MTMRYLSTRSLRALTVFSLAAALGACGATPASDDAGIVLPDSGDDPGACSPPAEPYGTSMGRNFRPFTLNRCDGTPYQFYGEAEGYCDARFSVLLMSAGWCAPCVREAEVLEEQLVQAYAGDGVRVIQVLIQDENYEAPSNEFCQAWVDRNGLTNPVLNDPTQITQVYFPAGSLPATLVVDSNGVIVHREYGASTGLSTIRAALDSLIAAE